MDMKTIGIPPCTGTPGQPQDFNDHVLKNNGFLVNFFSGNFNLQQDLMSSKSVSNVTND